MQKSKIAILNGIVAAICLIALVGYFLFPVWTIKAKITFTEELAELVLENMDSPSPDPQPAEEGEGTVPTPSEDEMMILLIEELVEENVSLEVSACINTRLLMSSAISSDLKDAENLVYSVIDELVKAIDAQHLKELENSITKAGVSAAVKVEIKEISKELGEDYEDVMAELEIDDEYIDNQTTAILDAISDENATVDSVTDVVVDVVKDVYTKIENHPELGQDMEELTPEAEAELREEISSILSELADENGNFEGDGLLSSLLAGLLGEEGVEDLEDVESYLAPSHAKSVSFAFFEHLTHETPTESTESTNKTNKPIDQTLADTLKGSITNETLQLIRIVSIGFSVFIFFAAFWWILLLIKILAKISMRNPLIKLKAPIVFGGLPFIILVLVPTTAIKMLSNPPTFLAEQMGAETVAMLKALFGKAINISFSSSSIVAFICGIVLFGFGFYYSSQRRAIKRKIKAEKREQMQSGGLY